MFAIRKRTSASLPTKPTAQLAPTVPPVTVRTRVASPGPASRLTSTKLTAQFVLRRQTLPEIAARLAASLASVWLITSRFPTVLHVVLVLPEHQMSARHQAASPESVLPLITIRRTVRYVPIL